jgi:putative SOS response-associated peptidase YedK
VCGRFAIGNPKLRRIAEVLGISFPEVLPRYNVAPTQEIPAIRRSAGDGYELLPMRWGLVPHWSREPGTGFSSFNARAESAATKPAFRDSFRSRRCLIPASGFYEWEHAGGCKHPWYFTDARGDGFAFAGLWDLWRGPDEELTSCTILVGPPNNIVGTIHDRMPVILPEEAYAVWLDPRSSIERLRSLLVPFPSERMRAWPVSAAVGNPRNESPDLIEPVADPAEPPRLL